MDKNLKKYFLMSVMFCFFLLTLIVGFTVVEKNTHFIISGENLSLMSYKISNHKIEYFKIHFMGKDFAFNF